MSLTVQFYSSWIMFLFFSYHFCVVSWLLKFIMLLTFCTCIWILICPFKMYSRAAGNSLSRSVFINVRPVIRWVNKELAIILKTSKFLKAWRLFGSLSFPPLYAIQFIQISWVKNKKSFSLYILDLFFYFLESKHMVAAFYMLPFEKRRRNIPIASYT